MTRTGIGSMTRKSLTMTASFIIGLLHHDTAILEPGFAFWQIGKPVLPVPIAKLSEQRWSFCCSAGIPKDGASHSSLLCTSYEACSARTSDQLRLEHCQAPMRLDLHRMRGPRLCMPTRSQRADVAGTCNDHMSKGCLGSCMHPWQGFLALTYTQRLGVTS